MLKIIKYIPLCLLLLISKSLKVESKVHTFAVIADAGHPNENTSLVRKSIKDSNIRNLIIPGDNLYDLSLGYEYVWDRWKEEKFNFSVVALGNHHLSYEEEITYFKMPSEYYLKKIEDINFIVLNSDNEKNIEEQAQFLVHELEKIKNLNSNQQTFLVFHHPPATISYRHSWQEREVFQNRIRKILKKYEYIIDAIFVGHDHQASFFLYGNIPVIVSGAIFEYFSARWVNTIIENMRVKTIWAFKDGYFWTRVDINTSDKTTWINFVDVQNNRVACSIRISKDKKLLMRDNCYDNIIDKNNFVQ